MFSKCKDDPIIDPKTTYPRRCCNLYCQYTIPDRVRPYCGRDFCTTELTPACKPQQQCEDHLYTVCKPVCAIPCKVLCSQKVKVHVDLIIQFFKNNVVIKLKITRKYVWFKINVMNNPNPILVNI